MIVQNLSQIIKADPGWFVIYVWDDEPDDNACGYSLSPIIAWNIIVYEQADETTGQYLKAVEPILFDGRPKGGEWAIVRPDWKVEVIGLCTCQDIAEYVRRCRMDDWN